MHTKPVADLLPAIIALADSIRAVLSSLDEDAVKVGTLIPVSEHFTITFYKPLPDKEYDIFVIGTTLHIPILPTALLERIQSIFDTVQDPFVFEHEACHLLDNYLNHDLSTTELETRAAETERLLANQSSKEIS